MAHGRGSQGFAGVVPLVAVVDGGSFRAAASQLGISTAAVSKAVAKLERELDVTLLERNARRVVLTREGALYLEHARRALAAMHDAAESVAPAQAGVRGEVRVTMPFIASRRVIAALPRLLERHGGLSVQLQVTDHRLDPVAQTDVALRIGALPDSRLVARRLRSTRWITVAAPEYLARRGVPRDRQALVEHECLRFRAPDGRPTPWSFAASGHVQSQAVHGRLVVDQGELLLDAALAGLGIAQVMDFMLTTHLHDGRLVEVLAAHAASGPPIHAVGTAAKMRSAAVKASVGMLAAALS
ncbi:MAG: LysR family transcriptional regulator [Deltaproteobacteria bacterium]|nr:LysR family transcriptional regulator [Deltaproteobacteria bacterium]MBK8238426.1 LysR family transcriptional regulator [Deltaproteobacteria bacterium]MBK8717254.1 LysR family transcriptional regulator [Deltaproteobacteria bacterium]MBP7286133.1 LysR family transcriptional regulator [Nannocystaceae bacterium]